MTKKLKLVALFGLVILFVYSAGLRKNVTYSYESYKTTIGPTEVTFRALGVFTTVEQGWYSLSVKGSPYSVAVNFYNSDLADVSASVNSMELQGIETGERVVIWEEPTEYRNTEYSAYLGKSIIRFRQEGVDLEPQNYRFVADLEICIEGGCVVESIHGELILSYTESWGLLLLDAIMSV